MTENVPFHDTPNLIHEIADYMRGYVRHRPEDLTFLLHYLRWQHVALDVLAYRAARFLDVLPGAAMRAVANGGISLATIARELSP